MTYEFVLITYEVLMIQEGSGFFMKIFIIIVIDDENNEAIE